MACETVFVLFMIYYTIEEVLEISKHRMKYFYSFWNVLDVIVLILGYMCIIYNLYRTVEVITGASINMQIRSSDWFIYRSMFDVARSILADLTKVPNG